MWPAMLLQLHVIMCLMAAAIGCSRGEEPTIPIGNHKKESGTVTDKSELLDVLIRGQDPAVDIEGLLSKLDGTRVRTKAEAEAICDLLKNLPATTSSKQSEIVSRLFTLAALFQDVETKDAHTVLLQNGIPELCRIFDERVASKNSQDLDDALFTLKILAMYKTESGTDRVIRAARMPLKPDAYLWEVILAQYHADHPQTKRLFKELSTPLPKTFLAVALLDCANGVAIHGTEIAHPFNSDEGIKRLQEWLTSRDKDKYSYAHSAAVSIPYIRKPERDRLLAIALDHPSVDVQMEGAWASAKAGNESGVKALARYCLDPNQSEVAREYLTELGLTGTVPREALAPDFRARAVFARWLAHPNELGRPPDSVEIVDHRELNWPPDGERKSLWLVKYCVKDTTGLQDDDVECGLVGSVTFCLFSYKMAERPPEDVYAIHCYWELQSQKQIREIEPSNGEDKYRSMLAQWRGEPLKVPEIVALAELSPKLHYPQNIVALASASLNGEDGWVVLDGPRSAWYPKQDMPDAYSRTVLMVHIGRVLLGFDGQPDRRKFLTGKSVKRDPQQVIAAYERLLREATSGDDSQKKELLGVGSPLEEHFQEYVDALVATSQSTKVGKLIDEVSPYWDHNLGYGKLGTAAFRSGHYDIAERYFTKLRQSYKDWTRGEEMGLLAEIWLKRGRIEEARALLIECLKSLLDESKTATGSDRKLFEKWFQQHRSTYLKLFPERGDASLRKNGIPPTTRD